jgi:hypothetical protein
MADEEERAREEEPQAEGSDSPEEPLGAPVDHAPSQEPEAEHADASAGTPFTYSDVLKQFGMTSGVKAASQLNEALKKLGMGSEEYRRVQESLASFQPFHMPYVDPHPEYKLMRQQIASAEETVDVLKALAEMQADSVELMRQTVDLNRDMAEKSDQMVKATRSMKWLTVAVCVATVVLVVVSVMSYPRASQPVVVRPTITVTVVPSPATSPGQP